MSQPDALALLGPTRESAHFLRRVVRRGDDIVIEGYPRSANTFATHAFILSQKRPMLIGNHFHSPAQLFLAKRYRIPAMLVLRAPLPAASSMVVYDPRMSLDEALQRYVRFHRPLIKISGSFIVAPFEEITTDFGKSIDRLNQRFGTKFSRPDHNEEFTNSVFQHISKMKSDRDVMLNRTGTGTNRLTIPNAEKNKISREISAGVRPNDTLLSMANKIHDLLRAAK